MRRPIVEPTETKESGPGGMEVTKITHPAFGQISVHHISGTTDLYGSDFSHQHFVKITVSGSVLRRDLNHDWHFEKNTVVEVALSEVQYAAMVGSRNRPGVPCTITQIGAEMIPGLPRRDTTHIYSEEVNEKIAKTLAALKGQRAEMLAATDKLSKTAQARVTAALDTAIREIEANLPFVVKTFNQHVEESVEKAKVEVEAYITSTIHRTGLEVLRAAGSPLAIEHKGGEN